MNKKEFTLIELMIVVAIISILSAIILSAFFISDVKKQAKKEIVSIIADSSLQLKKQVKKEIVSIIVDAESELEKRNSKSSETLVKETKTVPIKNNDFIIVKTILIIPLTTKW